MENWWENDPIVPQSGTNNAVQPAASEKWWENDPIVEQKPKETVGVAEDVARSVLPGISQGVSGIAGIVGDASNGIGWGIRKVRGQSEEDAHRARQQRKYDFAVQKYGGEEKLPEGMKDKIFSEPWSGGALGSQEIQSKFEEAVPALGYEPQTFAGKLAKTTGSFAVGATAPGGALAKAGNIAIPALVSETAGYATEGTGYEPYARVAGALAGGLGAAKAFAPTTAEKMIMERLRNVPDDQLSLAEGLMKSASQQHGIDLTFPEAVAQVTNGRSTLPQLQRVVENAPGEGAEIMRNFMANRPEQIERAGRAAFDQIAPPSLNPSNVGPQIQRAAEETLSDARKGINTQTKPLYDAARDVQVPDKELLGLWQDPGFMDAFNRTSQNPYIQRELQGLSPKSVGYLDEVKKTIGTKEESLLNVANPERDMRTAASAGDLRRRVTDIAKEASPEYAQALKEQERLRRTELQPLLEGPIGRLAKKDLETAQAIDALFPSNPMPGMSGEVGQTMKALHSKNPPAARHLIRLHAERVFNEATQNLQSGPNEFGGAKFSAALLGNPEQRNTFEAAVKNAYKNGDEVWKGLEGLDAAFQATGKRLQAGSATSFNNQIMDAAKNGKFTDYARTLGLKAVDRLHAEYLNMRLEGNMTSLARLFTNPEAVKRLRKLGTIDQGSTHAAALAARLIIIANQAKNNQ